MVSKDIVMDLVAELSCMIAATIAPTSEARILLIVDTASPLARRLGDAYRKALPHAQYVVFDATDTTPVFHAMQRLTQGDVAILVQSMSFRLNAFRFRLELFKQGVAVIEHPHLERMQGVEEELYLESLVYDGNYYRGVGMALKQRLDACGRVEIEGDGTHLLYDTPLETTCLNVGDYTGMKNKGGQFPIGEVFTEAKDFTKVNGTVLLFAYGGRDFRVVKVEEPIRLTIEAGQVAHAENAPQDFLDILAEIKATEPIWVRELGLGMNRAFTKNRLVSDIGTYERMCGVHLSLGQKHTIYAKPGMPKRTSRYHVDVFVDATRVLVDGEVVYQEGAYVIE